MVFFASNSEDVIERTLLKRRKIVPGGTITKRVISRHQAESYHAYWMVRKVCVGFTSRRVAHLNETLSRSCRDGRQYFAAPHIAYFTEATETEVKCCCKIA